jgi:hypothetical protein
MPRTTHYLGVFQNRIEVGGRPTDRDDQGIREVVAR